MKPTLDELAAQLTALTEVVEGLVERTLNPSPNGHGAPSVLTPRWNWSGLSDDALTTVRRGLRDWVAWLVEAYELGEDWPGCWEEHSGLVMELVALREWHRDVYAPEALAGEGRGAPPNTSSTDYVSWHDALWRFRERALPRLRECRLMGHR